MQQNDKAGLRLNHRGPAFLDCNDPLVCWRQNRQDFCLRRDIWPNSGDSLELARIRSSVQDRDFEPQLITNHNRPAKACPVNSSKKGKTPSDILVVHHQDGCRLCQCLNNEDPRH